MEYMMCLFLLLIFKELISNQNISPSIYLKHATKTRSQALARNLTQLLDQYGLWIVKIWVWRKTSKGLVFHSFSKGCQYVTINEKVCKKIQICLN
jgi:hypothetical protein